MTRLVGSVLLGALLVGVPSALHAQERPEIGFGLGLNVATLDAPDADVGVRQLFAAGLVAQMGLAGPLSVQSQLLFDQKGAVVRGEVEALRYAAAYIDLPVLLRLKGPSLGSVDPYLLAGGFGGVKIFEQQRGGSSGRSLPLETSTSFFKRTNAGLTGGVAGTIRLRGDRRLNVAVRYSQGLTNVSRDIDEHPFTAPDGRKIAPFPEEATTRTVSVMVRFGL